MSTSDRPEVEAGTLPLAVVVDRMAADGPRNEAFVGRFSRWFHDRAPHLTLEPVETLGLVDVVLTFRMKGRVTLVATGRRPDLPGEVTVHFAEQDLPFVNLTVHRAPRDRDIYEVCTLDHGVEGRAFELTRSVTTSGRTYPAGTRGETIVAATIGGRREVRADLAGATGGAHVVPRDALRWLEETAVGSEAGGPNRGMSL